MRTAMTFLGLDIGSISVNLVAINADGTITQECYLRTHGRPLETALRALENLHVGLPAADVTALAVTGTAGKEIAGALNGYFANEIIAQSSAAARLHPQVRTIIELGGEDAKLITLDPEGNSSPQIRDFAMNTVCAAGTGSFLDQQAARLGISIEEQFGALACASQHAPRIAGRCSVFAKSDMIHLQQAAAPVEDILMGLCLAVARNFKSSIAGRIELQKPIAFQGGVALNRGMVKAFEQVLELAPGELLVPRHCACMGAIGAVFSMLHKSATHPYPGPEPLRVLLRERRPAARRHAPLRRNDHPLQVTPEQLAPGETCEGFLGVDVGSISTNLVVIDRARRVLARRYLMTAGRPIEAVRDGLAQISAELAGRVRILGVTSTGSGRYMIGDFIGADFVKNEITAQARGAVSVRPDVDTIFEIGGQDSKYIRLKNGAVVDFTMNKVCAAGTGSFLEEQAEKLGISLKDDFSRMAFDALEPVMLGERCTVFMESSLNHFQQAGLPPGDLVAGLAYSIVLNYINRVVEKRPIGDVILFQGGTAYNHAVTSAFEMITGKPVIVPPHHDVLGALGAALIALEQTSDGPSRFKGFNLAHRTYSVESFECTHCANNCEIRKVSIEGERPLHYGSRCGKFDEEKRTSSGSGLPRLFAEREALLLEDYTPSHPLKPDAPRVGIPRAALFFELYPFFQAFFSELGFRPVPSLATSQKIIERGCDSTVEEICFPIKVAHGHVTALLDQGVDYLLLPCIVTMDRVADNAANSYNCPYVQSLPYLLEAALDLKTQGTQVLRPVLHFDGDTARVTKQLIKLARDLGCRGARVRRAIDAAFKRLQGFRKRITGRGREVLATLPPGTPALVLVSRSYNGCDASLNFRIPDKLRDLGALAIPLDFISPPAGDPDLRGMYWRSGQRILAGAHAIAAHPNLHAVYVTNFSCGPDSFILKYFDRAMQGKPYLTIELDEHSADAGVITRLEAFLDSLNNTRLPQNAPAPAVRILSNGHKRTVYVPYMDDHSRTLVAAMRHNGLQAEALPMSDEQSLEIGRRYTSGKECYPCILTTGDIVRKTMDRNFDPERACFFMPSAMGPCRFGQYSRFHRMVLDDLGLHNVPIVLLDQTVNYESSLSMFGRNFRLLGWQSVVLVDGFKKLLLQTRPYELTPGDSDRAYEECLIHAERFIEQHGRVNGCAEYAVERFSRVAKQRNGPRPLVGIVGEIYVRSNQFSNNFFIRTIEQMGGEAVMPTVQEWVSYTDGERRRDYLRSVNFCGLLNEACKAAVQHCCATRIQKPFQTGLRNCAHEAPTREVMRHAAPYLCRDVRGEAALSMGRAVEYALAGAHGIVNLMPFSCMPGTIVNTLLWGFARDYPDIPMLKMVYDGTLQSSDRVRIEAFMHQARQAMERGRQQL
ncbi:MAG: CoA activase [Deltaproteobacteria bacterium]|nr:CoA activase [Deltaproteobacteria bacterium]